MTRLALLLVPLALPALGCQSGDSGPRTTSDTDGVSYRELPGYDAERQRGSLVLVPRGDARHTLAIRTAPRDEFGRDDDSAVVSATAEALAAMPEAEVNPPSEIRSARLPGARFSLRFVPPGRQRAYEREHVVLLAEERIIHVFHTAPAGELGDGADDFQTLVSSLKQEG